MKLKDKLNKDRKVFDTKVSYKVLFGHVKDNFLYGFGNGIVIAFVGLFIKEINLLSFSLLIGSYLFLKSVESKIFNREKYTSNFGKKYVYPIPSASGFVFGVYLTTLI